MAVATGPGVNKERPKSEKGGHCKCKNRVAQKHKKAVGKVGGSKATWCFRTVNSCK